MKNKAREILDIAEKYNNSNDILNSIFGISSEEYFDIFVIAPSWTPNKIFKTQNVKIANIVKKTYFSSYKVDMGKYKIAWLQCGAGAGNLIDTVLLTSKSKVDKVLFIGAAGALKNDIQLGEISTPLESYSYEGGSMYLFSKLDKENFGVKIKPHNKSFIDKIIEKAMEQKIVINKRKVFCTDSIICEYSHIDFIKNTESELIEMETAAFYKTMKMMNKNGIALLCVSDNSVSGVSLLERNKDHTETFHKARESLIPKLIEIICKING